jgi:hypothetical protein
MRRISAISASSYLFILTQTILGSSILLLLPFASNYDYYGDELTLAGLHSWHYISAVTVTSSKNR